MRVFMCLAVLLIGSLLVWTYYVYAAPQNWDELFHVKTSLVSPSDFSTGVRFRYSIDHPSIKRHVYRWVLYTIGVREMNVPDVDYTKNKEWNFEHGRVPPFDVSVALRFTNLAFMLGALVLIFFAGLIVLKNPYMALTAPVGLILSNRVAEGVVAYLGCDAILGFFMALSIFVWVALAQKDRASSTWGILIIAGVAGLALSSKLNGGLVIAAYCAYLAIANKGLKRLTMPVFAAVVCMAVFVALNPITWGGPEWTPLDAFVGMFRHRRRIWMSQYMERPVARMLLMALFFPYAAFLPAFAAAAVFLRKERWVLPVCVWAVTLVAGTLLSVNRTYARYYLPVDMAVFTAAGLFGWGLIRHKRGNREKSDENKDAPAGVGRRVSAGTLTVAIAAAIALLTFVVAYEPLGPFRTRSERSVAEKVALFYRQAAAYYGFIEQLDVQTVKARLTDETAEEEERGQTKRQRPGIGPVRLLSGAACAAACGLVFVLGYRFTGFGGGCVLLLVLLWTQFSRGSYYVQAPEDKYFVFFGTSLLLVWIDLARETRAFGRRRAAALGVACGLCMAASALGIILTAATVLLVLRREGTKFARVAELLFVAAATFAVVEPALCYLGARGPIAFVRAGLLGSVRFWPAKAGGMAMFLKPVENYFPWLALLPLGIGALLAMKKDRRMMPVALWSGVIIAVALATRPAGDYHSPADVNFALVLGSGLPAMVMLAQMTTAKPPAVDETRRTMRPGG